MILIIAFIGDKLILNQAIRLFTKKAIEKNNDMAAKFKTLFSVIRTFFQFIIYFAAALFIIQVLFDTSASSVITITGILGVVAGLGAQSIVKDSLSGFFILLENQYAVGDLVTVEDFTGFVESVTIRTTIVKNFEGDRLIIPNGNMTKIINHSRSDKSTIIDVNISYSESVEKALDVICEVLKSAKAEISDLTKDTEILGIENLGPFSVTIRLLAHCNTGSQFTVRREILKRLKTAFDENNILMPFQNNITGDKYEITD
jgi:small conductance mechanosensitive channel